MGRLLQLMRILHVKDWGLGQNCLVCYVLAMYTAEVSCHCLQQYLVLTTTAIAIATTVVAITYPTQ